MERRTRFVAVIVIGVLGVAIAVPAYFAYSDKQVAQEEGLLPYPAPYITPVGVTTVDVVRENSLSVDQYLWTRLGDEAGNPLYTYDRDDATGKASCVAQCAKQFPPFIAAADARAFDVWSLVMREDGSKQWAYQGKPLYRYAGDRPPPGPGTGTAGSAPAGLTDPASVLYSPVSGWRRAAYMPERSMSLPAEVRVKHLMAGGGYALVTVEGRTLYALTRYGEKKRQACSKEKACRDPWIVLPAPALAAPIGDFTVVLAADGTAQWAYKGAALYAFAEDYSPGDVTGASALGQAALVYRDYTPANVTAVNLAGRGWVLSTQDRKPLYARHSYKYQSGGTELRNGYRVVYETAKRIGTRGCDAECLKEYRPLEAPLNAKVGGNWEIATREDGSRQWVYMGTALYTYAGDRNPGDLNGGNRWDYVYGHNRRYEVSVTGGDDLDGIRTKGSALFWRPVEL